MNLLVQVNEEGLQVEGLVKIVREKLQIEHLLVKRTRTGLQERLDHGNEHVLAKSAFGFFAPAHQLCVDADVRFVGLHPFTQR